MIYWDSDNYHFWIQKVSDDIQINNITITSAEKSGADTIALIDDVQNMSRIIEKRCENTYAQKSDLNIYIQSQQDLAILVGEHVVSIVTINSQISNLERENTTLKTRIADLTSTLNNYVQKNEYDVLKLKLDSLENLLTRIKYTFSVPNSTSIRYQFEKQLDAYEGTLYLNYNENKDNVASEKEIKINISFNVINTPTY